MGWPQQIWYTWNQAKENTKRWIMPGQYYSRQVSFQTSSGPMTVDMFFLDTNIEDTDKDPNHDICSDNGNQHNENAGNQKNGWYCAGFLGRWKTHDKNGVCEGLDYTGPNACVKTFKKLWREQLPWLKKGLQNSRADWQIIVTHFPAYYPAIEKQLRPLALRYGVDLIVTGHVHGQEIHYQKPAYGQDWGNTAIIVSGGGGGIFSEGTPKPNGHDNQYGFMDLAITKKSITVSSYSWNVEKQDIIVKIHDGLQASDGEKCCWGNYWGCEKYPAGMNTGVCSGNFTVACSNDADCSGEAPAPAPSPKPSPSGSAAHCSGAYKATNWEHNRHGRYEGGLGNACTIYWDDKEGWVLNSNHNTNTWVCTGGKDYKFPSGHWKSNPHKNGMPTCTISVSGGRLIRMMKAKVLKSGRLEHYNESLVI